MEINRYIIYFRTLLFNYPRGVGVIKEGEDNNLLAIMFPTSDDDFIRRRNYD